MREKARALASRSAIVARTNGRFANMINLTSRRRESCLRPTSHRMSNGRTFEVASGNSEGRDYWASRRRMRDLHWSDRMASNPNNKDGNGEPVRDDSRPCVLVVDDNEAVAHA